jgi:hypothetical protein
MAKECLRFYKIPDFDGRVLEIPISREDDYTYFFVEEETNIRDSYDKNSYVVIRNLLSGALCDEVQASFEAK